MHLKMFDFDPVKKIKLNSISSWLALKDRLVFILDLLIPSQILLN